MKKVITHSPEIKLVGMTCRTNNVHLFEADPAVNQIAETVQEYFYTEAHEKIMHRKKPGVTYCAYTHYESDLNGDYTYLIGEEVESFGELAEGFEKLVIPAQTYAQFTNQSGPMPDVCVDMWKNIWKLSDAELGGKRSYIADFELYDERSKDHANVVLDICIGIKQSL